METIFNKTLFVLLTLGLLVAAGATVYAIAADGDDVAGTTEEVTAGGQEEDTVPEKASDAPQPKEANFDPRDERQVVGGSDDAFFGWILKRTGSEKAPPIGSSGFQESQTQYAVKVTQVIKGELSGTIALNRRGGSQDAPDAPGGGSFLEEGREYLFATKYVEAKGWHQVVLPRVGVMEVEDWAHREELRHKYEEAYADQIEVNMPLPPATPEEEKERSYRPCWPDGSTPTGGGRSMRPLRSAPRCRQGRRVLGQSQVLRSTQIVMLFGLGTGVLLVGNGVAARRLVRH